MAGRGVTPAAAWGRCLADRACPVRFGDGVNRVCPMHQDSDGSLDVRMHSLGIDMTSTPGRHEDYPAPAPAPLPPLPG